MSINQSEELSLSDNEFLMKPDEVEQEQKKRYVLVYHDDADGWGALGLALNGLTNPKFVYVTRPVQYGDDFSKILEELRPTDHVYVMDFSFSRELCDAIYAKVEKFVVLDHHRSAAKHLADAPYATFDMNKSGVLLAWEHFFPELVSKDPQAMPVPVRLLDNYDLWKKKDEYVHWDWVVGFHLFVTEHFGDFTFWRELMAMTDLPDTVFAIVQQKSENFKATIEEIMKSAEFHRETINGRKMIFYPAAKHISLLADAVRDANPGECDFTASYFVIDQGPEEDPTSIQKLVVNVVNFRGTEGCPVSDLAEKLGGGGHAMAAGCNEILPKDIGPLDEYIIKKIKTAMTLL